MLDRVQTSVEAQRNLLDDVGHELRTPIAVVRGHLELTDPADPEDVRQTQLLAIDELDRMGVLIDDLILLAKSSQTDFITPVDTDVAELTELDSAGADEGVIAMVNGMGATPLLELYLMYGEISRLLRDAGITVARNLVGNYITSLDMAGCSLTLVRADAELLSLWDAPVNTPGLRWGA